MKPPSDLMIRDKFVRDETVLAIILHEIKQIFERCKPESEYTKVMLTFAPGHPYQSKLSGTIITTEAELIAKLGQDSLHPERFKWEADKFMECYDRSNPKAHHHGWHDLKHCTEWVERILMVFDLDITDSALLSLPMF